MAVYTRWAGTLKTGKERDREKERERETERDREERNNLMRK